MTFDETLEDMRLDFDKTIEDLQTQLDALVTKDKELEFRLKHVEDVLTKDSTALSSLIFETVFPNETTSNPDKTKSNQVISAVGGTTTYSSIFDISKQSKDASGNVVVPHSFYVLSAYVPSFSPAPRVTIYNGTPIAIADVSVYIERTAVATPTRFESRVGIYNLSATTDVYVKVLKLLGVR